jgi:hypothetical protein
VTFCDRILPNTRSEDQRERRFDHPDAIRGDGPELICCGHFDGHDVYRRLDVDLYVLVYANDKDAVFEVFGSKANRMIAEAGNDIGWGTARAIKKARECVRGELDELIIHLRDVVMNLPDEGHNGWCRRAVDSCCEAADWLELLRIGVGV